MSDDETQYTDEDEEEVETKSIASSVYVGGQRSKRPSSSFHRDVTDESSMNEAEKAMIAVKKRHEDEEALTLQNYEDQRRIEREREEEELRLLKEKQEQRRLQREEEERELAERRVREEERRRVEEEERRLRLEEERRRKEEALRKRQQLMGASFASTSPSQGGRNFVIPEKKDRGEKFGNIVQAKQEMGMTKEQQEDAKRTYLTTVMKAIDVSNLSGSELKAKIKELHHRICKLETDKYDHEKRHERQEYDLKELNERQRQMTRHKALKKGLDPSENSRYPPKVVIASKYDRQTDRRNFMERRSMFDKVILFGIITQKNGYPCFPNVPPPPTVLEYKIHSSASSVADHEDDDEDD